MAEQFLQRERERMIVLYYTRIKREREMIILYYTRIKRERGYDNTLLHKDIYIYRERERREDNTLLHKDKE